MSGVSWQNRGHMPVSRRFALVDCNSFYCSCERVFQPKLRGKPVVVLSNNDGCIIARTDEAKALGIPMAAPFFAVRELVETHGVEVFSSNYALYGDMSRRVMQTLALHAPAMEVYSIDEAFLCLDELPVGELEPYVTHLRSTVRQWTGIPVGIGVGATKVLSKIANRAAKKRSGVFVLDHASAAGKALLDAWPCKDLWGIASRLSWRLETLGIRTAGELARATPRIIRRQLGVVGERMVWELNGVSCLELEDVEQPRKNICCSRSFGRPIEEYEELRQAVAMHATRAGEKLRRQNLAASAIAVFLTTNRFRPDLPQYHPQLVRELLVPTAFTPELIGEAMGVLRRIYRPGFSYTKAGVLCLGLVPDHEKQGHLFKRPTQEENAKEKRLMAAVDKLNLFYGRNTVRSAAVGFQHGWQMRQARKSPCYTTRIEEIPTARL